MSTAFRNQSSTAVLKGRVVDGYLKGARAHAEYKVIGAGRPYRTCFQGTISIKQRGEDEEDDDD